MRFTPRQQLFVEEYLIDLDARHAAIRAGYRVSSAKDYGDRLLRTPHVAAAIAKGMAERAERTGITRERVLAEYAKLAFVDLRALADWGPQGVAFRDADLLSDEIASAIAMIAEAIDDEGAHLRITLFDKMQAPDALAALLDPRHEPGGLLGAMPQGHA
jgi:phage terminase small subunit